MKPIDFQLLPVNLLIDFFSILSLEFLIPHLSELKKKLKFCFDNMGDECSGERDCITSVYNLLASRLKKLINFHRNHINLN